LQKTIERRLNGAGCHPHLGSPRYRIGITTALARNSEIVGPYSRAIDRGAVGWSISGRSREGRFLRAYERMLTDHLGGKPSRVQAELIRRCSRLALHLELQDERSMQRSEMSDHASRQYLAWHGALIRTLRELGLQGAAPRAPTLADYVAARTAATAASGPHAPPSTTGGP
jgi:hypothetical protein